MDTLIFIASVIITSIVYCILFDYFKKLINTTINRAIVTYVVVILIYSVYATITKNMSFSYAIPYSVGSTFYLAFVAFFKIKKR
jgi:hypothetical protein